MGVCRALETDSRVIREKERVHWLKIRLFPEHIRIEEDGNLCVADARSRAAECSRWANVTANVTIVGIRSQVRAFTFTARRCALGASIAAFTAVVSVFLWIDTDTAATAIAIRAFVAAFTAILSVEFHIRATVITAGQALSTSTTASPAIRIASIRIHTSTATADLA